MSEPVEANVAAIVDTLDDAERGFVLGTLLLQPAETEQVAAALEGPSRDRCAAAVRAAEGLPRNERVQLVRALAGELLPTFPDEFDDGDVAAWRQVLHDEPRALVEALARDAPAALQAAAAALLNERGPDDDPPEAPDASVEPAATPASPPASAETSTVTPVASTTPVSTTAPAASLPAQADPDLLADLYRAILVAAARSRVEPTQAQLIDELAERGAAVLGLSLRDAGGDVLSRAAARLGDAGAALVLAAARSTEPLADEPALTPQAARAIVTSAGATANARETLARIGARALGTSLAWPSERGLGAVDRAALLAERLPPRLAAQLDVSDGRRPPLPPRPETT